MTSSVPGVLYSLAGEDCKVGRSCRYKVCFGVTPYGLSGEKPVGACGTHVSVVVRYIVDLHGVAAVVQEIPQVPRRQTPIGDIG